ncbi:MAG TPA: FtsW/RodA/SpoVE family cell cycle protein [Virgibacillus sp.]|nr:FtsW/RodA/SpoVE family cell cycle protein [Virgibacillus sp.]
MSKKQSHYIRTDLIFILLLFISVSLLAIYNAQQLEQYASENFVLKQAVWFLISIGILAVIQFLDLEQLYKSSIYVYGFGVLILIILWLSPASIAKVINGSKSWFTGLPGLSLQPSEFTKIALILFLAALISQHKEKYKVATVTSDIYLLLKIIGATALPVLFTIIQPDLGTSLVYVFIAGILILLAGIGWKIIATLIVGGASLITGVIMLVINFPDMSQKLIGIKPYQINRIVTWFDPTQTGIDTFHIDRSMLSLGSGQLFGKGMSNIQVQLPEAHTDFIFSIIGESFGFMGSAAVIFLYFLLFYKLVTLGLKVFKFSPFGSYICFGFMSLMIIHTFQNIGMTIGIMPITGIPLLLISYGGSSILSTMIGFALVYRVAVESSIQNDYLFK